MEIAVGISVGKTVRSDRGFVFRKRSQMFAEAAGELAPQGNGNFATGPRIARDAWIIRLGWAAPIMLPVIFLLAWIYVLAQGMAQ